MITVSKTTGHLLDGLYFAVQPLSNGIGYTMFEVSQNIGEVALQGFSRFDHGFQSTVGSPEIPTLKVFLGIFRITVIPKVSQRFANSILKKFTNITYVN